MSDAAENHGSPVEPGDLSTFTLPSRNDTAGSVVTTALDPNESQPARQRRKRQERRIREQRARQRVDAEVRQLLLENEDGRINNPLGFLSEFELRDRVEARFERWDFSKHDLDLNMFIRAGRVAQKPEDWDSLELTKEERRVFRLEETSTFWDETHLRVPIALCCIAAMVQGFTQSSANAANLYYPRALGMTKNSTSFETAHNYEWLFSVQNAVPFLAGSTFGAGLSDPLQEYFYGRRGAMFIAGILTLMSVIGAAFSKTKYQLLAFRILLGLGMGAKASVVPIYAAEVSPARLRGRLVINWQVFDAFGIFLAFTLNLIFAQDVQNGWRLMFGAGLLPTLPLLALVFACPESPRFLMKRGLYIEAYRSFLRLRGHPISAAKDMIYLDAQLEAAEAQLIRRHPVEDAEKLPEPEPLPSDDDTVNYPGHDSYSDTEYDGPRGFNQRIRAWWHRMWKGGEPAHGDIDPFVHLFRQTSYFNRVWNLVFSHPRVRRASLAAAVVMLSQQLCGINILAFYSSSLFKRTTDNPTSLRPLWYSWGFAVTNFLFSFPAYPLVDRKGRRWLLLWTFPFMAVLLLATGLSYKPVPALSYAFIILFTAFYSVGGGPVPFAYSAEVYPLANREAGMSFAVFWNFIGAGLLTLLVPQLLPVPRVLLGVFAGLCMLAFVFIFLFMPETKRSTLEDINFIFGVPTIRHARYQFTEIAPYSILLFLYHLKLRKEKPEKPPNLYRWYDQEKR